MISTVVLRLKSWTPLGKKASSSLGICSSKSSGSAGDQEFRNLALMGILELNSVVDMHFKVLVPSRIRMMYCRGFLLE